MVGIREGSAVSRRLRFPRVWVTILLWRWFDMPRLPRIVLGKQVGTANPISMRSKTASRATVDAPLGFVTLQTAGPARQRAGTGLAGIGFFDRSDGDARCRRFVG